MRRFPAVAPIVLAAFVAAPFLLFAQRGGGHGGFSGHSSSSFHAGFSSTGFYGGGFSSSGPAFRGFSPGGFAGAPRYRFTTPSRYSFGVPRFGTPFANRFSPSTQAPFGARPNFTGFAGNRAGSSFARSGFAADDGHRPPYRSPHGGRNQFDRNNFPYDYYGYPDIYLYPPLWDYDDLSDDSQAYAPQESNPQDYGYSYPTPDQQPEYPPPPAWPSLNAPPTAAPSQIAAPPQPAEAVTLVFNDGTPQEKIHNYLLTPTTLYVMDQHPSEIPVAELNLAATAKVNREAGIDFTLPRPSIEASSEVNR